MYMISGLKDKQMDGSHVGLDPTCSKSIPFFFAAIFLIVAYFVHLLILLFSLAQRKCLHERDVFSSGWLHWLAT